MGKKWLSFPNFGLMIGFPRRRFGRSSGAAALTADG
jgi:hypothetical protein